MVVKCIAVYYVSDQPYMVVICICRHVYWYLLPVFINRRLHINTTLWSTDTQYTIYHIILYHIDYIIPDGDNTALRHRDQLELII